MQDVKKIDIENKSNHKRIRRRKKNMTGYYFLVAFLAALIAVTLSLTILFNVSKIDIEGIAGTTYNSENIVSASGIREGENLVRMDTGKIREKMLEELLYIDDVQVKKSFPNKVIIAVTPSIPEAYVECKGGYMKISRNWRIIGHTETPENDGLIVINGFDCKSNEEKTVMESNDPDKDTALKLILDEIREQGLQKMVAVDISDKYDIVLNYDNRINIKIEKPVDVEYKLRYAYKIITDELRENKSGYLIYRNSLGYSYVSEEEYKRVNGTISKLVPKPDSAVTEAQDEYSVPGENPEITEEAVTQSIPDVQAPVEEPQAGW